MATIASRLTNTGALLVNGGIDEVTFNTTSGVITNKFATSQTFSGWTPTNTSVITNNVAAPDGTFTASKLVEDSYNAIHRILTTQTFAPNVTYTMSTYAKAGERRNFIIFHESGATANRAGVQANLQTGTISNYTTGSGTVQNSFISSAGNGWYRFGFTFTGTVNETPAITFRLIDNTGALTYTGDGTSGLYIWGAQFEQSANVTTYQGKDASTILTPTWATKTAPDTVYATGQFDEVTYTSGFAKRETQTGNLYVTGSFDEFTGAPVVDSSLLLWFDAAQTTSYSGTGTLIRNLANTAQSGTMYGNVTYSSDNGGKFVFNNYLDTTNTITAGNVYPTSVNDPWTAEAWVFVPTGATWSNGVNKGSLYLRGSYGGCYGLIRTTNDNQVGVVLRGNTTTQAERWGTTVRNQWNQVVGVWTGGAGGNLQCYVNGTLTQSGTTTQDDPIKQTYWYIGGSNAISGAPGSVFEGNVSGVKLYTRALSADEVAQNFNALRRRYNI